MHIINLDYDPPMGPSEMSVDPLAVFADDELVDSLVRGSCIPGTELTRTLVSWRREVDAVPGGKLVHPELALAVISGSRHLREESAECRSQQKWRLFSAFMMYVFFFVVFLFGLLLALGG